MRSRNKRYKRNTVIGTVLLSVLLPVVTPISSLSQPEIVYGATTNCAGETNSNYARKTEWVCGCYTCGGGNAGYISPDEHVLLEEGSSDPRCGTGLQSKLVTETIGSGKSIVWREIGRAHV